MIKLALIATVVGLSVVLNVSGALQGQGDDAWIVSLKSDNSLVEDETIQNDEPSTGLEERPTAEIYSLKIHSDIRYRYCRTQVLSKMANPDPTSSREVVFQVVLPETAYISKFSLEMAGKTYEAYVKEKEEAKQIYSAARNRGQSAGLVEINARHANVFNVNVNVEAKSKVTFNLTYEELLVRKFNRYEHNININPAKFARIPDFQVTVDLQESQNITFLKVPVLRDHTENSVLDEQESQANVSMTRPTGKSAFISWSPTVEARHSEHWGDSLAPDTKKFVVQYDVARESDAGEILLMNGYFVHFFAPQDVLPLRKHVVFVLDTSGSMTGTRIAQLKQAMTYVLDDLKPDDYFNIIEFSTNVKVWNSKLPVQVQTGAVLRNGPYHYQPESSFGGPRIPDTREPILATEENLQKAHEFIKSLVASGGTAIFDSLVEALKVSVEAQPTINAENAAAGKMAQKVA